MFMAKLYTLPCSKNSMGTKKIILFTFKINTTQYEPHQTFPHGTYNNITLDNLLYYPNCKNIFNKYNNNLFIALEGI
jgi:hypothetical protein